MKTFNLLSIGQRGTGKTVFLAGSYAELQTAGPTDHSQQLWFDCQDSQVQDNMEDILSYVARTGQYPPATMKIAAFNFSLQRRSRQGAQTLCHFRWWDIPGEICNINNPEFQRMVSTSDGCCVFIDAYALVHDNAYLQKLEEILKQVMAVVSLVSLNGLKYAFALILTKYDLLEPILHSQQRLEEGLQPLATRLKMMKANYQTFYSSIPVVGTNGASTLRATGAAAPLLWLVQELSKAHNPGLTSNLLESVNRLPPRYLQSKQNPVDQVPRTLFRGKSVGVRKILGLPLLPSARKHILTVALASMGLAAATSPLFVNYKQLLQHEPDLVDYEQILQREPNNLDALRNLATLYLQQGHVYQALPLVEKLVQREPESLNWRLQLAQLYETTGQLSTAEIAYDEVLSRQHNNFKALAGKAVLRNVQGDTETAKALFMQAEQAAPANLKMQVHDLAQETLQISTAPVPPTK